ncbi:MAG TPA: hypothetical protein PKA53_08570 [Sphingobacterium sp.]|nr:hypothetical protein [Sphingobacterium sp.]
MRNYPLTICTLFSLLFLIFDGVAYGQSIPQIYIHTDRDIYFPGDRVWYKAYVLRDGKLDPTVRNLYIDWGDEKGNVFKSDVALLADGVSSGSFYIPGGYSSSVMHFNAYLARMDKNREYGYYRTLGIVQKEKGDDSMLRMYAKAQQEQSPGYTLQIIDTDPTKIAVQILTENPGSSAIVKGRINYYDLFEQALTLQSDKVNQIVLPTEGLEPGVMQIRVFDQFNKELVAGATLIGVKGLVVRPAVQVSGKDIVVELPTGEEANMSVSVSLSDLPFDTVHTIVNDMLYANLAKDNFPRSTQRSPADLSKIGWRWSTPPEFLFDTKEENLLKLRGEIVMDKRSGTRLLKEKDRLVRGKKVIRGVSFGSQAANESEMSYKLFPWEGDFGIRLSDMVFFGAMEIQTKLADPELQNIPFEARYTFKNIEEKKTLYIPEWEDYRISHDLTKEWLPVYDVYQEILYNQIDTVEIRQGLGSRLVDRYDPGPELGVGRSEIINVQLDEYVRKYSIVFEQYFQQVNTTKGALSRNVNQVAFFLNRQQVDYQYIKDMDMINFAYVRVFYDPSSVPGLTMNGQYRSVLQLVELPPSERRGSITRNTKVEGYVEIKDFADVGKMTYWWQPLLQTSGGSALLKLPMELLGKRISIQGVTASGKLVYFNGVIR